MYAEIRSFWFNCKNMYYEPFANTQHRTGWIEIITGCMFSGKTEELIRRLNRARYANQTFEVFNSQVDMRAGKNRIQSHDETSITSIAAANAIEILKKTAYPEVMGIDEGQFFDQELPEVCKSLANKGIRVIVAGLDMDFKGKPFGSMPALMAIADSVTKLHAICVQCGNPALFSHRKKNVKSQIAIGASELYEPLCRKCYSGVN
jgi:thymidine kinase